MRYLYSSTLVLATTVFQVVAGPAHVHHHQRQKKDAKPVVDWDSLEWNSMGIDWKSAWAAGQKTAAPIASTAAYSTHTSTLTAYTTVAAPTAKKSPFVTASRSATGTASVPASATAHAPSSSATDDSWTDPIEDKLDELEDDVEELFDGLVGLSNNRKHFGEAVPIQGEVGDYLWMNVGKPYASNIYKVNSHASEDFTVNFFNTQGFTITINIWNKNGPDGQVLSGSALAPFNTSLTMALPSGKNQTVAFDNNSGVAWAEACSARTPAGAYDTTWGEATFASTGSGYDMSAIQNSGGNVYNMTISSLEVPCVSSPLDNFWLTPTKPVGQSDGSCYIPGHTASLNVLMAGPWHGADPE